MTIQAINYPAYEVCSWLLYERDIYEVDLHTINMHTYTVIHAERRTKKGKAHKKAHY